MSESSGYARWLASLDDAALRALLAERPEALARPMRSFNDLASLLANPISVEDALRQLDRRAVQVAGVLGTLGPSTPKEIEAALARSGAVPPGHVKAALDRLTRSGLAWPDARKRWQVPKAIVGMAGTLCGLGIPLLALVERTQLFHLRPALRALGLSGERSVRDAAFALSAWARDEEAVGAAVAAAPQSVRDALERIAVHGPVRDLDDRAVAWLAERCLLVPVAHGASTVPAELVAYARGDRVVGAVRVEPVPSAGLPTGDPAPLLDLVEGLRALLERIDATTLKPLQSGGIGVQEQRRLAKALEVEHDVVRRMLHLAGDAGLLSTGTRPGLLTTQGAAWLALDEVPAAVELGLSALDAGRVGTDESAPLWGPSWQRFRPSLRDALASLVGAPDRPPAAWLEWRWFGAPEGHVAATAGTLEWLGLVTATGVQPWAAPLIAGDEAAAVRAVEAALPAEQDDVVLQADGTAVVAGRPSTALRVLLQRVAHRESERTWRVAGDCLRAAFDAGATADELLEQLGRHSRHAVPQVVEQLVRDVAAQHGRIVVVPSATLLRVDDVPLAVALLRDRKLAVLALQEVQQGVLSSVKKPADVLAALRAAGYAPAGPPEPARRRPAGVRSARRQQAGRTSVDELVAVLRAAPREEEARLATVHELPVGPPVDRRFDHLPAHDRLLITEALRDGGPVEIDYVDSAGRATTRVVEKLEDLGGGLLEGWCRLRDDERNFVPAGIIAVRPAE